jgi:hypothetical protein
MRFCPNCGNPLGGSPRYCAGCATHVGAENSPASTPVVQASPAIPLPVRTHVGAWSFHDPPALAGPWPASAPPWEASPPPPTSSSPPWAVSAQPPAGDPGPPAGVPGPPRESEAAGRGRWSRLSAGHGMTITAMVTTVALLATGGIATWQAGQIGSHTRAANVSLARHTAGRPRGHARSRAASPSADSPATGSPTTGSPTPGATVIVAPDVGFQPHAHRVALLLDRYFAAINQHEFQAYSSLFIPAIRVSMHNFGSGYQSTRDSRTALTGLVPTGPQGLAAMVTFVSHQNPAESPDHAMCDRWHITLFLKRQGGSYHIRRHRPGFPADTVRACR